MNAQTGTPSTAAAQASDLVQTLAGEIGPRRPTSRAERVASELIRETLERSGIVARVEGFDSYASFGYPYGVISALACAPAVIPRSWIAARAAPAIAAAGLLAMEGSLTLTPLSDLLSRRRSQNVWAAVEPRGASKRTLCLVAHADSSRSGLLFHPRFARQLQRWLIAQSIATFVLAAEPVLERFKRGRSLVGIARGLSAVGLALLAERELFGRDVPGANDNASGVGTVVQLAAECAACPLATTRLAVLVTGSEEAGVLGARAFVREHEEAAEWLFVNFDGVGAPATLRYLPSEGVATRWHADPKLLELAARLERERPELGLRRVDASTGLTYDATAVMARGGRALTLVAGDAGRIPNYHRASDTVENLDPEALGRAIEVGRALIAMVDRGEADI